MHLFTKWTIPLPVTSGDGVLMGEDVVAKETETSERVI